MLIWRFHATLMMMKEKLSVLDNVANTFDLILEPIKGEKKNSFDFIKHTVAPFTLPFQCGNHAQILRIATCDSCAAALKQLSR